jgi:hypothetical protein
MTKAELIAALATVDDDADIYLNPGSGSLRFNVTVEASPGEGLAIIGFIDMGEVVLTVRDIAKLRKG